MDGYRVLPMADAAPEGDLFITSTGDIGVVREEHFRAMKDGAIVANAGHFDVELDLERLREIADEGPRRARESVQEYVVDGKRIAVLGEGRLVNLAAAEGHPASVMDMSFANQALAAEYLLSEAGEHLERDVHRLPDRIDREIARLKLEAMGVRIDALTEDQQRYLGAWDEGT
jgi:adenosylhomocysteinase